MTFTPLIKGLITAVVMIGFSLIAYYFIPITSPLHWLVFGIYAVGIIWTLLSYKNSSSFIGKFGDIFNTGFRCFIVATLLMVLYTFTFSKMHPEFAENAAKQYKEQELKVKNTSKTPDQIDAETIQYRKGYNMAVVYGSILTYLLIGVAVTGVASVILTRRK